VKRAGFHSSTGFTLIELMITTAVSAIVLTGFMWGVTALQRSFTAAEFYSTAQSDETRIMDYIIRDVRRALTLAVASSPPTLTITATNYIDPATGAPRNPTVTSGAVNYGAAAVTITYTLSGSNVVRTENGTQLVIASNVTSFTPVMDATDPSNNTVIATVTFSPNFKTSVSAVSTAGTALSCKAAKRN
jgi:prepilin-type N-terminal cleavage/methylation domain-containing protein